MTRNQLMLYNDLKKQFDSESSELLSLWCRHSGSVGFSYDECYTTDSHLVFYEHYYGDRLEIPIDYLCSPESRQRLEDEVAEMERSKEDRRKVISERRKRSKEQKERDKLKELIEKYGMPNAQPDDNL